MTQDEDKQNKNKTKKTKKMSNSKMLDINIRKQTQYTISHELSYKQPESKANRTSLYVEIVMDKTTRN